MTQAELTLPRRSFGQTMRADVWWAQPLLVFLGLGAFIVYSTWAAFQGKNYYFGPYISPFYSPEIFGASPHSWFGPKPVWWPAWLLFSPALLDSLGAGRISAHLLLLSRRLLQSVLGRSAGLHRRRAAQDLPRRAFVPAHHAERAPLFSLSRAAFHCRSRVRCLESDVVHRSGDRKNFVRHRRRHDRAGDQCRAARRLHFWLSFACAIWSADFCDQFSKSPDVLQRLSLASAVSIAATCSGPG